MPESAIVTLAAAFAGGAGAVLRFVVAGVIMAHQARRARGAAYPWGVTVVNLSGSFAIGVLVGTFSQSHVLATVLGVGLLGGYTTFGTVSYDTVQLLRQGRLGTGLANGVGQLLAAVLVAWLGVLLGAAI